MSEKIDLYSMTDRELADFFVSIGEPKFRAKQLFSELHRGKSIEDITTLSKSLRGKLREMSLDTLPKIELKLTSKIAMKAFASMMKKKKNPTEDEKKMAKYIDHSYDISDEKYIEPIVQYIEFQN